MELLFVTFAFISGLVAQKLKLPPLVGFLAAGFILSINGFESNELLVTLADLGVTLLLFTIGLKLNVRTLTRKEIWLGSTLHNLAATLVFVLALGVFKLLGISSLATLDLNQLILLGFALSFSSTVFAIKALQDNGEMNATYGTMAIGILIMQDIFAVVFLTASTGKFPEWYAIFLFALPFVRPILYRLLDSVGHGEMLVLFGMVAALVFGAALFELVGMKGDLGALVMGMLLAGHSKASELSKTLFNLKELFLVCFFLNIGLSEQPTSTGFMLAIVFMLLLPLKGILYFLIINGFKFRARTSFLASLTLFNYSEFGLIVGGLAYKMGWMSGEILVGLAIAVALSFVVSAPLNRFGHALYRRSSKWLREHAEDKLHHQDRPIRPGSAQVLILGMGRVGTGAYDELTSRHGSICMGVEMREETADHHQRHNRNVITGDATDSDFWERILDTGKVQMVLLAMPHNKGNQIALDQLRSRNYQGKIAAIAEYQDQVDGFIEQGVDAAFDIYREAGSGFAKHVCEQLTPHFEPPQQP
jgi:predicted Kef-type K+ transport protein